jgi:hypothetical protein
MQRSLCNLPREVFFVVERAELVPVRTHRAGRVVSRVRRSRCTGHSIAGGCPIRDRAVPPVRRRRICATPDSGASNRDLRMPRSRLALTS